MRKHTNRRHTALVWMLSLMAAVGLNAFAQTEAPTDAQIADAIADEFEQDTVIPENNLDVDVEDGTATLGGTVSNLLAKERAARIAETVRGVVSVLNTVLVRPREPVDDTAISENVRIALIADPAVEKSDLDVQVSGGKVSLSGTVSSWQEKQLALKVAKAVKGVREVASEIDVDYDVDRTDAEIDAEVRRALNWNALVDDGLIVVQVDDAVVSLKGTVGSAAEKTEAITTAWVAGVEEVDATELEVSRWGREEGLRKDKHAPRMDTEIAEAVARALEVSPEVPEEDVEIDVMDAEVTLRGRVDTVMAKRSAARAARNTVGVKDVTNRLRVRPDVVENPRDLATRVRDALKRNAYIEPFDITVRVVDGEAHLYGDVDTQFQKAHADEVAAAVVGITDVDNHLNVLRGGVQTGGGPYVDPWELNEYAWASAVAPYPLENDAAIREEIEQRLAWSSLVNEDNISVVVDDGAAQLIGTVGSAREKRIAERKAYVGGAVYVNNNLEVRAQ